jgi:hypothetical protein
MALISQAELEARLGRSLTAEEASAFNGINASLQAQVEKIIDSKVEGVSETTKYFDGGVQHLSISPCTNITALKLVDDDQTAVYTYDTTDYIKEPINGTLKTMLRHRAGPFQTGMNNLQVTAKFSINEDADTLAIIKDAMLDALVSEINNSNNIKKESIEGYSVEYATTETKSALAKITYLFPAV